MDRIDKALARIPAGQRSELRRLVRTVRTGKLADLDIQKLKGYRSLYRVRRGGFRLIVRRTEGADDSYEVIVLEGRSETTYKDLRKFD
ncbi:MAG: hypothetical protein Q8Q11_01540 [bacterium]|nr:hypothetical protein [bacterium]MDZ4247661.1 hypothetical protein [Patescibacteria group bacterium]